jgi:anti-sigma B factor antagonist
MRFVRKVIGSIVILDITGEIRLGESAKELSAELAKTLSDPQVAGVIIQMENINYIDSTGLGELVGYLGRFQDRGKRLKLVNPNQTVMKLLQLTKLDQVFKIYHSEERALDDFVE